MGPALCKSVDCRPFRTIPKLAKGWSYCQIFPSNYFFEIDKSFKCELISSYSLFWGTDFRMRWCVCICVKVVFVCFKSFFFLCAFAYLGLIPQPPQNKPFGLNLWHIHSAAHLTLNLAFVVPEDCIQTRTICPRTQDQQLLASSLFERQREIIPWVMALGWREPSSNPLPRKGVGWGLRLVLLLSDLEQVTVLIGFDGLSLERRMQISQQEFSSFCDVNE